jgi:hypothetical protein
VVRIAKVVDAWVAVVNLEKLFFDDFGQLLRSDGPMEVRVIKMGENRAV